jgi:surfactin synthase thioesterase subunit
MRFVGLPFAGGGNSALLPLARSLPEFIEPFALQLPGRETLSTEPFLTTWEAAFEHLVTSIELLPKGPVILFGHSLGAELARALAVHMTSAGDHVLHHLYCAGRPWPGTEDASNNALSDLGNGNDAEMLEGLAARVGPLPPSLARAEIRDVFLPILRADLLLLGKMPRQKILPLASPLTIIAGRDDPMTNDADLTQWKNDTAAAFEIHLLESGHFFLDTHAADVADLIKRQVS